MSLKIYENLFTGPFNISEYVYRKNKKKSLILFVEKSGKDYSPSFHCVDIIKTKQENFIAIKYYNNKFQNHDKKSSIPQIFFKEFKDDELNERENLYYKIVKNLKKEFRLLMQY
jgi:hypothetical protein